VGGTNGTFISKVRSFPPDLCVCESVGVGVGVGVGVCGGRCPLEKSKSHPDLARVSKSERERERDCKRKNMPKRRGRQAEGEGI